MTLPGLKTRGFLAVGHAPRTLNDPTCCSWPEPRTVEVRSPTEAVSAIHDGMQPSGTVRTISPSNGGMNVECGDVAVDHLVETSL
ncbi:hypothetical protein [Moorena sp. SIO3A2]|uniref:hypothetical protein n=1 Tax=Moorena sp. SIO3A2 TaxID=2607841 RepID=UPI0013BB24C9|nr:hypothetical protein [Moorena sp. SIO3A2]NER90391.1 hypothetical protein [Moorena sp. SIO3A2]